ncbi:MAG: DUF1983 domain-containing protein [Synergistaceae bacterium]|jgi:predicted phage tail protein|nr:DUF1983 domain-containing protein [Synergistaceae bacterium]
MSYLPVIKKQDNNVTLTMVSNPFDLSSRTVITTEAHAGQSLASFLEVNAPPREGQEWRVSVNGRVYEPGDLNEIQLKPGDYVSVCPALRGGEGGKNPFAILAGIALAVFSFGAVGPAVAAMFGGSAIAGQLAAGLTLMLGGQLISNAFAPKIEQERDEQSYRWGALQTVQSQGGVVPITYGTVRTAGQVLSQHISIEGDTTSADVDFVDSLKDYLRSRGSGEGGTPLGDMEMGDTQFPHLLLCGGEGPIDEFSDIRINDNPIGNFQDAVAWTRPGTNTQSAVTGFDEIYDDVYTQYTLEVGRNSGGELVADQPGEWSVQDMDGDVAEYLEIQIDMPTGLYRVKDNKNKSEWIELDAELKPAGGGSWAAWMTKKRIEASKTKPLTFIFRKAVNPNAGKYSVRMRMHAKGSVKIDRVTTTTWTRLSAIMKQPMTHPGKALVGVRIKATEQLSGGMPTVTWKQTRKHVLVYDKGEWVNKDARNPAWIIYDLCVRARQMSNEVVVFGEKPSRIDLPMFKAWAEWNDRELNNRPAMRMNLLVDEARQLWEWVNAVAASARGAVFLKGTKISCVWDQPYTNPAQLFTMGNIQAGSFGGEHLPIESRANAVEISFLNEARNYEQERITVYGDGFDAPEAGANPTAIQLTGITDFERAYREGMYRLNQNKYILRTVSFSADIDALPCQVGDVVLVQHDIPRWGQGGRVLSVSGGVLKLDRAVTFASGVSYQITIRRQDDSRITASVVNPGGEAGETDEIVVSSAPGVSPYDVFAIGEVGRTAKPFRVQRISRDGDMLATLTCTEYIEALYTEPDFIPIIDYSEDMDSVTNLAMSPSGYYGLNGSWVTELWAHWNYRGRKPLSYDVEWKRGDKGLWGERVSVSEPSAQCPLGDTTLLYSVRVRGVFGGLPPTDWAYAAYESSLLGSGIAPSAPANLSAAGWFGFARLSWENPPDVDLAYIEVWEAGEDNREKAVHIGQAAAPANGYTQLIASGATKWYWIRAVNHTGQKSDFNAPEGTPCVIAPESHEAYMDALLEANPYLRETIDGLGERIDPIETGLETIFNEDLPRITEIEIPEIKAVLLPDLLGRIKDAEAEIQDRITPAIERVSQGVLRLADESDRARDVFRWAGIEVDEEEGRVVIRAVEDLKTETGYQLTDVEQRIDAQEANINLRATRTYVDELAASLISSVIVAQEWKFSGSLNGWTAENAELEALPASMKYSVTEENPSMTSPDAEIDGETNNIIGIQFRRDAGTSPVKCRIQYKTAEHGYSDSHMKRVDVLGSASVFRSVQVDMHGLDAGGDDWKNSTVTGIRICLGQTAGEEYEISLVNAGQSSLSDVALQNLQMRITQAEVNIDGANAVISLKADQTTIDSLTRRLDSAEITIDALGNSISLKANRTELTPLESRISSAEIEIDALGGKISQQVLDYQGTLEQIDRLAEADLEGSLSEAEGEDRRRVKLVLARQELTARIEETNKAIAEYNLALTAMIEGNRADYSQKITAVVSDLEAEATRREILAAQVGSNTAAIQYEEKTRADADNAAAERATTLEAKVGSASDGANPSGSIYARLKEEASVRIDKDSVLEAKYGVRLDVNDRITGFVINNKETQGNKEGNFIIMADKFAVVPAGSASTTGSLIFDTVSGTLNLKNVNVDWGLIKNAKIDGAYIKTASIDTLRLANRAVTIPEGINANCDDWLDGVTLAYRKLVYDRNVSSPKLAELTLSELEVGKPIWLDMTLGLYTVNTPSEIVVSAATPEMFAEHQYVVCYGQVGSRGPLDGIRRYAIVSAAGIYYAQSRNFK